MDKKEPNKNYWLKLKQSIVEKFVWLFFYLSHINANPVMLMIRKPRIKTSLTTNYFYFNKTTERNVWSVDLSLSEKTMISGSTVLIPI
ncbi:hypothetical protein [Enterococcus villorum]|uniref:hypothetical protein n=1 Tax=Enterococcus villorum TaxID=112904 RepID=UPI0015C4B46D|nr:hypothetical protein [Enterococcus villorum]